MYAIRSYYDRVLLSQNSGCADTSAVFSVTVVGDPTVSVSALETTICAGGTALLSAVVSGGAGTSVYQWQYEDNGSWVNVGMDNDSYETPELGVGTYSYQVLVSQNAGCGVTSETRITSYNVCYTKLLRVDQFSLPKTVA